VTKGFAVDPSGGISPDIESRSVLTMIRPLSLSDIFLHETLLNNAVSKYVVFPQYFYVMH
jgi:hypothetical protein